MGTGSTYVQVYSNHLTEINFTNCHNLKYLWAAYNDLTSGAMERILGEIYSNQLPQAPYFTIQSVFLNGNGNTTSNAYWFYDQLRGAADSGPYAQYWNIDRPESNMQFDFDWTVCQSRAARNATQLRFDWPNAGGNMLFAYVSTTSGDLDDPNGITDDAENTWVLVDSVPYNSGAGTGHLRVYYVASCNATTGQNRVYAHGGVNTSLGICEIAGANASNPIIDTHSFIGDGTNWCGGLLGATNVMDTAPFEPSLKNNNSLMLAFSACQTGPARCDNSSPFPQPLNTDCGVFGECGTPAFVWYVYPRIHTDATVEHYAMISILLNNWRND